MIRNDPEPRLSQLPLNNKSKSNIRS
jgi:hypothetical protein